MITAFKEQLKRLSETKKEEFHHDLRKRVGKRATLVLEERLTKYILLMPDLITRIYSHWNRHKEVVEEKQLMGFVLSYLYHPKDFLDENHKHFFGYLDDAYMVGIVYEEVIREFITKGIKLSKTDESLFEQVVGFKKYVKGVLPKESQKIEKMVTELLENSTEQFDELFATS